MKNTELEWLYKTAKGMDSIVEIGAWQGRSSYVFVKGCPGHVFVVDHFLGSQVREDLTSKIARQLDIHREFRKHIGSPANLSVMIMDSLEAAKQFEDKSVDMVFVDGDHSPYSVKADSLAWLPKCRKLLCDS